MIEFYILDGHKTKKVDMKTWAKGVGGDMKVAKDSIGGAVISTVFLGINHNWGEGDPVLFETMVFGGEYSDYQECYVTWNEALKGHKAMVKRVKRSK